MIGMAGASVHMFGRFIKSFQPKRVAKPDLGSRTSALDGLNDIDWSRLEHAYGPADDVPDLLRSLISTDKEVRDEALNELFGNVWHQGTVCSATSHVVPFLTEMLESDTAPDREGVIMLFALIASGTGYLEVHAAEGNDAARWADILRKEGRNFGQEMRKEHQDVARVRRACRPHLGMLLPYLANPEPDMRMEVARALSAYPEERDTFLPALEVALANETDDVVRESLAKDIKTLRE